MAWEGGRRSTRGVIRPFLRPRKWKMGGSSFFGRESKRLLGFLRSMEEESPHPLFFRPILHPFFGAENRRWGVFDRRLRRSKIEDGGLFDLRLRRSKMGRSTIFVFENRRSWESLIFGPEDRRLKERVLLSSDSKIENGEVLRLLPKSEDGERSSKRG